LLLLSI